MISISVEENPVIVIRTRNPVPVNMIISPIVQNTFEAGAQTAIGVDLIGTQDGSNATFTTPDNFVPGSVEVICGGVVLSIIEDFQTIGTNTIQFTYSPKPNERIMVNYLKQ